MDRPRRRDFRWFAGLGETSLEKFNIIGDVSDRSVEWARAARNIFAFAWIPTGFNKSDDFVERSFRSVFSLATDSIARKSPGDFGRFAKNVDFFFESEHAFDEFDHELPPFGFFHRFEHLGIGPSSSDSVAIFASVEGRRFGRVLAVASRVGGQ